MKFVQVHQRNPARKENKRRLRGRRPRARGVRAAAPRLGHLAPATVLPANRHRGHGVRTPPPRGPQGRQRARDLVSATVIGGEAVSAPARGVGLGFLSRVAGPTGAPAGLGTGGQRQRPPSSPHLAFPLRRHLCGGPTGPPSPLDHSSDHPVPVLKMCPAPTHLLQWLGFGGSSGWKVK